MSRPGSTDEGRTRFGAANLICLLYFLSDGDEDSGAAVCEAQADLSVELYI